MIASFFLALAGLALFALCLPRHRRQAGIAPSNPKHPLAMRSAGWALLGCSSVLAVAGPQTPISVVEWIGIASVAAGCVVATLTLRATLLPGAAGASFTIGMIAALVAPFARW